MIMGYVAPTSLPDALQLLAGGDVKLVAGGTDHFPALADRRAPPAVLDISRLEGLRGISPLQSGWRIGAATTWTDIVRADLPPAFDGLKGAAREVGSIQIQNAGTIAGNLCNASPAADGVPPLLTLEAVIEVQSVGRTRHVALSDFITGVRKVDLAADELVVAIHIPALAGSPKGSFLKLGSRHYLVISIAMVSALVSLDRDGRIAMARVAVGACSPVAQRLGGLEGALMGQSAAQLADQREIWSAHLGDLSPIGDVRGSAAYRLEAAAELCKRAVLGAMGRDGEVADG
jgi:CO/xanthine dehydrogenase FAD-binding subunit